MSPGAMALSAPKRQMWNKPCPYEERAGVSRCSDCCWAIHREAFFTLLPVRAGAVLCSAAISQQSKAQLHCLMLCFAVFLEHLSCSPCLWFFQHQLSYTIAPEESCCLSFSAYTLSRVTSMWNLFQCQDWQYSLRAAGKRSDF